MSAKRVVIIGSGFGGLSAAIRLQARGYRVTILEKNAKLGGHAYQLQKNGYTFDMGPSLITAPDIIERVFASAGRTTSDYLDLIKLDPAYRIYFHDKSFLDYSDDSVKMKSQMAEFNAADADNYDRFMASSRAFYDAVITDGLGSMPFSSPRTLMNFLPRAMKLGALRPAVSFVRKFFQDPRHVFTFSFHPLFIGGNPFRAPSLYLMIPYLEKNGGVWFTKGGMYSVVQAFAKLFREMGGNIVTECEVEQIVVRNGRAVGCQANGTFYEADAVLSNADWAHTNLDLINEQHRRKWHDRRVKNLDYSMSAFLLYLGIKRQYPEIKHHTLILSERYESQIGDIFDRKIVPDDFSMYLHAPTRTDSSMAPEGCESMYVLIPVPNLGGKQDWEQLRETYTKRVLNFLEHDFGLDGLQADLEVCEAFTPLDFLNKQNAYLGSAWGVEPKLTQTAYFRPHNRCQDVKRLYFVGAGTHPGAGVPGVLLTSEVTEKLVVEDLGPSTSVSHDFGKGTPLPKVLEAA